MFYLFFIMRRFFGRVKGFSTDVAVLTAFGYNTLDLDLPNPFSRKTCMQTALIFILVGILFVLAFLLLRMALFGRPQPYVAPTAVPETDRVQMAAHLSRAIQFQTVSHAGFDPIESGSYHTVQAFLGIRRLLQEMYPRLHRSLKVETVQEFSLLYTWQGSDNDLAPILLGAHLDVVPVEPGSDIVWAHPPFAGQAAEGYIWGRGAMDFKNGVTGILEAVEGLLKAGYQPRRTVYLAFGHDEEVGGMNGARQIAALLQKRGVHLHSVLDEGDPVLEEVFPGLRRPVAMVGVAEKGFLSLELYVETPGGHSSMPPAQTSIGILSGAIQRLEAHPMMIRPVFVLPLLRKIGADLPLGIRFLAANYGLFRNAVHRQLQKSPRTNALMRSTLAVTTISGGVKDNLLPRQARAVVNCRIMPGDTIQSVMATVENVIADPRVKITPLPVEPQTALRKAGTLVKAGASPRKGKASPVEGSLRMAVRPGEATRVNGWEPTEVSDVEGDEYRLLEQTIRQVFVNTVVAPSVMMWATDARHYTDICRQVLRFTPVVLVPDELERQHGVNERLSLENLVHMVHFYMQWIQNHG